MQLCRNSLTISTYIWLYSYPLFLSIFSSLTTFPPLLPFLLLFSSSSPLLSSSPPFLPSSLFLLPSFPPPPPWSQERNNAANLEKKQKQIDKQITDWKSRYEAKEQELDAAQRESRTYGTEVHNWDYTLSSYVCVVAKFVLCYTGGSLVITPLSFNLHFHSCWSCGASTRSWRSRWKQHARRTSTCRVSVILAFNDWP